MNFRCFVVSARTGRRKTDIPFYRAVGVTDEEHAREQAIKYMGFLHTEIKAEDIQLEPYED